MKYYKMNKKGYIKFLGLDNMVNRNTNTENSIMKENFVITKISNKDFSEDLLFSSDEINKIKNSDVYYKFNIKQLDQIVDNEIYKNPIAFVNRDYKGTRSILLIELKPKNNKEIFIQTIITANIIFLEEKPDLIYFDEISKNEFKTKIVRNTFK
ncbi:hypothetical protein [Staphylococcus phage vB_StaM_SA1]|nr:hypothetical protein [Staphylococcus phage vB_StaM_SA1]